MSKDHKLTADALDNTVDPREALLLEFFRANYPNCIAEDGTVLWDRIGEDKSQSARFGLEWRGRSQAQALASKPSLFTLRPGEIFGKLTSNLIIEADNLEALKLLQKSYFRHFDVIYIDPPYNTGKDFVYEDNFADPLTGYLEQTGQIVDGKKLSTNTETLGRYHRNWLDMMEPRLMLAGNLLSEAGVIVIHIDMHELANLLLLCDDRFGPENRVGVISWKSAPAGNDSRIASALEYVVVYAKNLGVNPAPWVGDIGPEPQEMLGKYKEIAKRAVGVEAQKILWKEYLQERGDYLGSWGTNYTRLDANGVYYASNLYPPANGIGSSYVVLHPVTQKPVKMPPAGWVLKESSMLELIAKDLVEFGQDESTVPARKLYLDDKKRGYLSDLITHVPGRRGTKELKDLFPEYAAIFPYPKPVELIKYILSFMVGDKADAAVLDFFAGSGSTAQAVLEMNEKDGGARSFVLVQLPEVIDPQDDGSAEARKLCADLGVPENIAEITKERVRRVIKKLDGGTKDGLGLGGTKELDRGFKVYALDRSNFVPWDATAATDAASLEQQLELAVDNVLHDRSHADLLAEILLKTGFPLDTPITKVTIASTDVYQVADPGFLVCLAETVTDSLIKAIAATKPHRVVILDAAFQGNDALKTNAVQAFKDQGVEMFRTA